MNATNIKKFIRICPHKRYDKAKIENQFCIMYNKPCAEVIKNQECERYKTYLLNVLKRDGLLKEEKKKEKRVHI